MQILKGDKMKSNTINNILKNTNSYCCVYYDSPLPFEHYFVDSNIVSVNLLQGYLEKIDFKNNGIYFDYFLLYTNKTEAELSNLIKWLNGKENNFNCRCILISCKL